MQRLEFLRQMETMMVVQACQKKYLIQEMVVLRVVPVDAFQGGSVILRFGLRVSSFSVWRFWWAPPF
jgi:hypothetical protein